MSFALWLFGLLVFIGAALALMREPGATVVGGTVVWSVLAALLHIWHFI